ncbi:arylamine N-acetyltransferase [Streptomyces sp. M19]
MAVEDIALSDSQESALEWGAAFLDLDAYLSRIGYDGPAPHRRHAARPAPRARALHRLRERRRRARPGISLDMADVSGKLVGAGRGGYCFEHTLLFAAALERLGYYP